MKYLSVSNCWKVGKTTAVRNAQLGMKSSGTEWIYQRYNMKGQKREKHLQPLINTEKL